MNKKYISSRDYRQPGTDLSIGEWLGDMPAFTEEEITQELETDVIVCGGGLAGVAAAREAAENGAEVILLEKTNQIQARAGDFGVIGGEWNRLWGRDLTEYRNRIVAFYMRACNYRVKQPILKRWVDQSGEDFDWYVGAAPEYKPLAATICQRPGPKMEPAGEPQRLPLAKPYDPWQEDNPVFQVTIRLLPFHKVVLLKNHEKAMATGRLQCMFSTPTVSLIREAGTVCGVIARSREGSLIRIRSRKGVVLATGDYSGNHDMLYYYCPWTRFHPQVYTGFDDRGMFANTGDGHRMAMWIGARMEDGPHAAISHCRGGAIGLTSFLMLDRNGNRFCNEDCDGQQMDNQISLLPGRSAWQLFDARYLDQLTSMTPGHGSLYVGPDGAFKCDIADGLNKAVESGRALCAETIEELVRKMKLPERRALDSIQRYNQLAERGEDLDFGKNPSRLFGLTDGPFYAVEIGLSAVLCTVSGIESDEECRCYDQDRNVIPGLYVAGNIQGNRFSTDYPMTIPGMSHSMALTFGRVAGRNAAQGMHCVAGTVGSSPCC